MAGLPPVFIEFLGDATGFSATVSKVKTELATVEAEGGGNISKLGAVSKAAFLGIGIAAAGTAYETVKMAASFQTAMIGIHTQAGVAQNQLGALGDGVLNLAGQVGFSPDSLAESLYHVESSFASIGIKGPEALNIVKTAAEGAATGHADLVDVQNALDAAIASGIPGVQNYGQAMGALNAIVGSGDMQMQDLADAMGTGMLAVVKGYGLSLNDVGAALATFGDNNIRGATAATDLRMSVQALSVPAATAKGYLAEFGMTSQTLADDMQHGGLNAALSDLSDRMKKAGITSQQQGQVITTMFGKKAGSGLAVLMDQLTRFQSKYPELEKGASGFTSAWQATQATFQQQIKDLQSSLQSLGVRIGTVLLPYVQKMVQAFASGVQWLTQHKSAAIALGIALGTILAVGFAVAAAAAWNFTAAMLADPVTWIVLAIVALVAGLVLLILHWKEVAAWLEGAWNATVNGLVAAWHWLASETMSVWDNYIVQPIKTAWNAIASFFSAAWHNATDPLVAAWHWVANTTASVWNSISGFFRKWWPLLLVIFAPFIALVVSLWNHFHTQIIGGAVSAWNSVTSFLTGAWKKISGYASSSWHAISSAISGPVNTVWHAIQSVWNTVSSWLSSKWHSISSAASSVWHSIQGAITGPLNSAWNTVSRIGSQIGSTIYSRFRSAYDSVKNVGSWFLGIGENIVMGIVHGVENAAGALYNSLKNVASNALSAAKSFLGIHSPSRLFAAEVGQWIPAGIAQGISDAGSSVGDAVNAVTGDAAGSAVLPGMGGVIGAVRPAQAPQQTFHIEVHGSVLSENDLRNTVQKAFLQLGARNSTTWQAYRR